MSHAEIDWLARYRPWRHHAELGFWVLILLVEVVFNSGVVWLDLQRMPNRFAAWEPIAWELTSVLGVGLLIPAIVAFERRFPLRFATLPRHLGWHLLGSAAFCLLHVGVMVLLREGLYAALGLDYRFDWVVGLPYEYLKDFRTYVMVLAALLSYRFMLLRLQGEARLLDPPDAPLGAPPTTWPASQEPPKPERFLVRKLRREFLVAATDIAWLQAQGNYVGLHVNGHDYLLRSTLADFMGQLDPARFARVHRSYAVNLDQVAEIEPLEGGEARLLMRDGTQVPCSRRYRPTLGGPLGASGGD